MNKVLILSKEYPPHVYGGAGVHVDFLSRELAKLVDVDVRCFGEQQVPRGSGGPAVEGWSLRGAEGTEFPGLDSRLAKAMEPLLLNVRMAGDPTDADLVHCHTWYTMMAGLWMKTLYGVPLVVTTHSLEPLRPWKEEQLGAGYQLSSWMERTAILAADAVIAVSEDTRGEVLECYPVDPERVSVIHNGIDLDLYQPTASRPALEKYGISSGSPYILFVGRITRQKGVVHLVRALRHVRPEAQVVLCAGAPDTKEIEQQMVSAVEEVRAQREGVFWIREMVSVPDLVQLYSGAALFVCPSIYEPFGIINLEAMACGCPVVASRVGGIPEVVVDGETGLLVPFAAEPSPSFEPQDPSAFGEDLAGAINEVLGNSALRERLALAGRRHVEENFSWRSVAEKTRDLYERVCQTTPCP